MRPSTPPKRAHWRLLVGLRIRSPPSAVHASRHGRPSLRLGIPPAFAPSPKKSKGKPCAFGALAFFGSGAPHGSKAGPPLPRPERLPLVAVRGALAPPARGGQSPAFGGLLPRLAPPRVIARLCSAGAPLPFLCLARPKSGGVIRPQLVRALWRLSAPSCAFRRANKVA